MKHHNIFKIYLANFLKNLNFFGSLAIPYFIDWIKIDYTRIFLLQAWFIFWSFILEIPTGIVADKWGRRYSVGLGCLLFGVDMFFFGLSRNYYLFYLGEFLGALGFTLISGADKALLYDSLGEIGEKKQARYYLARYELFGTMGLLISFPVGSLIVSQFKHERIIAFPFLLTGIFLTVAFFVFLWIDEPERVKSDENFLKMGINGLKILFSYKRLRLFTFNYVTISAITFFMFWFYQTLLRQADVNVGYYGLVGSGCNLFAVILLSRLKVFEKYLGISRLLLLTAFVPGLLYIGISLNKNLYFILLAIFIVIGLKLLRMPILLDYVNQMIKSHHRATLLSTVSILEKSIIFILYPFIGLMADYSINMAFLILGIICLGFTVLTRIEEKSLLGED